MNPYRFYDENDAHLHQALIDGKWINLTGATSVTSVLAKVLTWWASACAVEKLGWRNPKEHTPEARLIHAGEVLDMIRGMDAKSYLTLLDEAYSAHSKVLKSKAKVGTDLHEELERFVKDHMKGFTGKYEKRIDPFIEWTEKNVKKFLWSEIYTYDLDMFTGGQSDAGAELNSGEVAVIDFKSHKEAYFSDLVQIGGYDLMITKNGGYTKEGDKIFTLEKPITQHIVVPFGAKEPYPIVFRDVESNKNAFKAALTIYRELNKANKQ